MLLPQLLFYKPPEAVAAYECYDPGVDSQPAEVRRRIDRTPSGVQLDFIDKLKLSLFRYRVDRFYDDIRNGYTQANYLTYFNPASSRFYIHAILPLPNI